MTIVTVIEIDILQIQAKFVQWYQFGGIDTKKKLLIYATFAIIFNSAAAYADYQSPENLDKWQVLTVGNCKMVTNLGSFRLNSTGNMGEGDVFPIVLTEWTGGCDANGLITGSGRVRFYSYVEDFTNFFAEYAGFARSGMLEGPIKGSGGSALDSNAYGPSAKYEVSAWEIDPSFGPPRFEGGCLRDEFEEEGCDPTLGQELRQQYLKKRGLAPVAAPIVAVPFKPAPEAPAPKASNGIWTPLQSNGCTLIYNHGFYSLKENYSSDFEPMKV